MPGFADSFWSGDYAGGRLAKSSSIHSLTNQLVAGLGVLFGKLQQGVAENQQMLTIARMRAEAEDVYGSRLGEIGASTDKITGGFSRDDGASVRKVINSI
jgi:hypothetical protein